MDEKLVKQYRGYSDKQLQMLFKLGSTVDDKKIVIEMVLMERGLVTVSTFPENTDVKKLTNDGATIEKDTKDLNKDNTVNLKKKMNLKDATEKMHDDKVEKPKKKVAVKPKVDKVIDFKYELGDKVKVPMSAHNKKFSNKIFNGEIIERSEWEGHEEYKIKCDLGEGKSHTFKKRQTTILKANPQ